MNANRDWLWDKNISNERIKEIFSQPGSLEYIRWTALLLARKNEPREIFHGFIQQDDFCRYWASIKRRMRKEELQSPCIDFWQVIYEKLLDYFKRQGKPLMLRSSNTLKDDAFSRSIGRKIQNARKAKGWTQKQTAQKMGISQQLISRSETGGENLSLMKLKEISGLLGLKIKLT